MKKKILVLSLAFAPMVSFAAIGGLQGVAELVSDLFGLAMPLLLSLAVLYFVWSLVKFMTSAGESKDDAREQMIWGVIILFVMVSVWGLVNILGDTIDLDTSIPDVDVLVE